MRGISQLVSLMIKCFNGCGDHTQVVWERGTRIWNLSDNSVELQIRVGSILKKVHTLKPGSSKRVQGKSIYKAYIGKGISLLYNYYDETCHPYIWIHCDFSRMVKQQYISLEDLRDYSDIKIYRDLQKGCICVRKKLRADLC